jgi:hypothetical protein
MFNMLHLIRSSFEWWHSQGQASMFPHHVGEIHALGYNRNTLAKYPRGPFSDIEAALLFGDVLETSLLTRLHHYNPHALNMYASNLNLQLAPDQFGTETGAIALLGHDYMAKSKEGIYQQHAPPPSIAHALRMPSCKESCDTCSTVGCLQCAGCVTSSSTNASVRYVLLFQHCRCPPAARCFFHVGADCFPIRDGMIVVLSGATPHGLWSPCVDVANSRREWCSVTFLCP